MVKIKLDVEVESFKDWDGLDKALVKCIEDAVSEYCSKNKVEITQKINYKNS